MKAQPVGMKARIDANKSDKVRPQNLNKMIMTANKIRKRSPLSILSGSWRSI